MVVATILMLTILVILSVFQIALAFGAPLGQFAWGGQHKELPKNLRIGSGTAVIIYAIIAAFIISKANFWNLIVNQQILSIGLWVIATYFIIGVLMNGISRSKPERYTMTTVSLVLAICTIIIATS